MDRYFITVGVTKTILATYKLKEDGVMIARYNPFYRDVTYKPTVKGWLHFLKRENALEITEKEYIHYNNGIKTAKNTFDNDFKYEGEM